MPRISPTTPETSRRMARVKQKDTGGEIALRRELHKMGLRYRVAFEVLKKPRRVADIAFPGIRLAVFVDGCFWHGCPEHATWPKRNADFWRDKIETNRSRDADTNERLRSIGWRVLRFWEHDSPLVAAEIVVREVGILKSRRASHEKN
ncbi:very short patch repair endonuclease [Alloalcanivorax xenomutans]|uniref:very short patch repair endonuclease n=1 Tax=Alloalcanivorax xenomutans TaxID=1094342 RepID=UPI0035A98A7E